MMNKELDDPVNLKEHNIQRQFTRYLLVGISSATIELLIFYFLRILSLNLTLSNIMAVIIATLFNFFVNRGWSFATSSKLNRSSILYLTLFLLNLAFSTNAIRLMVRSGFVEVFAKLLTMVLITMWNFVLYRKIIFK